MLYLECELKTPTGLRGTDVIAELADARGEREQVVVERSFMVKREGRYFLPVWGVSQARDNNRVLVELPQESAAGTNRIWVKPEQIFQVREEVAT